MPVEAPVVGIDFHAASEDLDGFVVLPEASSRLRGCHHEIDVLGIRGQRRVCLFDRRQGLFIGLPRNEWLAIR